MMQAVLKKPLVRPQSAQQGALGFGPVDEIHRIAGVDGFASVGDNKRILAQDAGHHDAVVAHQLTEAHQGPIHKRRLLHLVFHHADTAVRKLGVVQRAGQGQQAIDGAHHFLVRIDHHGY